MTLIIISVELASIALAVLRFLHLEIHSQQHLVILAAILIILNSLEHYVVKVITVVSNHHLRFHAALEHS